MSIAAWNCCRIADFQKSIMKTGPSLQSDLARRHSQECQFRSFLTGDPKVYAASCFSCEVLETLKVLFHSPDIFQVMESQKLRFKEAFKLIPDAELERDPEG